MGGDENRRFEYSGDFAVELLKFHYGFTDEQWNSLSNKEQLVKLLVFDQITKHPELRL